MTDSRNPNLAGAPINIAGPTGGEKPKSRRPRKEVALVVAALGGMAVAALTYTVFQREAAMRQEASATAPGSLGAGAAAPADLEASSASAPALPRAMPQGATARPDVPRVGGLPSTSSVRTSTVDQSLERLRQQKQQDAQAALSAPDIVAGFASEQRLQTGVAGAQGAGGGAPSPVQIVPKLQLGGGGAASDPNGQDQKAAFLAVAAKPEASPYLAAARTPAISKNEVKAGTVIPAVMVGGINSDLPGQIVGQVARNVYDTISGNTLLIPAGAKVIGTYDSSVSHGQRRVLVAWSRIIFLDGSSISLGGMPGADEGGYAGFSDRVNNHFWKMFGDALLMSVVTAGVQLSQPQTNSATLTSSQIMAASLGQQFGQVGSQVVQQNMNIQPTLTIRPGYEFNVMVTKDIILPPWRD